MENLDECLSCGYPVTSDTGLLCDECVAIRTEPRRAGLRPGVAERVTSWFLHRLARLLARSP